MSETSTEERRWAEVHARIDEVGRRLAEGGELAPEEEQRLLRERARQLARRPEAPDDAAAREVLEVTVGQSRLAIQALHVVEVLRATAVTPLPGAEAPVFALAGWRGRILTVLDVGSLVGGATPAHDVRRPLVVLDNGRVTVALAVDALGGLARLRDADVRPYSGGNVPPFVSGVTDDALLLLDTDLLLLDLT